MSEIKLEDAVSALCKALREDEGYRIGWHANIAMAFKDEYARNNFMSSGDRDLIDEIANQAATNFINLLIWEKR